MTVTESSQCCPLPHSQLIDRHLVDCSVDALRYKASAAYQIPSLHQKGCRHDKIFSQDNLLIASPYTDKTHLLDLSTVSISNRILAEALTALKPIREDYALAPYKEAFNWSYILGVVQEISKSEGYHFVQEPETFYIVVFRSCVPPSTDRSHLGFLDEKAHEEAIKSGGLLK